jgi:hypothetical protein
MEVITIDSKAYRELIEKIDSIANFVTTNEIAKVENPDDMWVDNYEVRTFLNISERTLQRLRTERIIPYSIISGKSYYKLSDIKKMMDEKKIKTTEECLNDLINNHQLNAQHRRNTK